MNPPALSLRQDAHAPQRECLARVSAAVGAWKCLSLTCSLKGAYCAQLILLRLNQTLGKLLLLSTPVSHRMAHAFSLIKLTCFFTFYSFGNTRQNLRVSSPAPVTIDSPSGLIAK